MSWLLLDLGDVVVVQPAAVPADGQPNLRRPGGLSRGGPFRWQRHNKPDFAGYRLTLDIDPDSESADGVTTRLTEVVLHGLRRASLIR